MLPLLGLLVRRTGLLVLVLLLVSMFTFGIVNVLPGDVAQAVLGDLATPEQVVALRHQMGLDLPLLVRYAAWLDQLVHGQLGVSLTSGQPIAGMLFGRLANSALLAALSLIVAVPLSIAIGVTAALRPGRWLDRMISGIVVICFSLPEYVSGLLLILVFSMWWPILPGSAMIEPGANPLGSPSALVLPVAVLTLGLMAHLSQITRAGMILSLESPYIRTATLKGLSRRRIVLRHALPNVLLPTIAEIGMQVGALLGGIVVVETLFTYAGVGDMLVTAVNHRDVPVVQVTVLVVAVGYGIGNLLADILSMLLDPRVRV